MARLKITQVKSRIGATKRQCANLDALGLKKIGDSKVLPETDSVKGQIKAVSHLVKVEKQ